MVMNEILLADGNNNYKLPHAGKDKIIRELGKQIPMRLPCTALSSKSPLNGAAIKSAMMADGEYAAQFLDIYFTAILLNCELLIVELFPDDC